MSCPPTYDYRPSDRPLPADSIAPTFVENRSRLFAAGTYFRSIDQGTDENDISLEITVVPAGPPNVEDVTLTVRVLGVIQEVIATQQTQPVFPATVCAGGIGALRAAVNTTSTIIEMQSRGVDFQDPLGTDVASNCVSAIPDTAMAGGSGPPANASQAFLDAIFTGRQRTIVMISTTENSVGFPITPPPSRRVQQYNGTIFISQCNLVQGACPLDGTCLP